MGVVIMLLGIGMVALPAGMLASRFSEELHKRREDFGREVDHLLDDGALARDDSRALERLRESLSLTTDEASRILADRRAAQTGEHRCPHCGKPLPPDDRDHGPAGGVG
jgi:voltage-gated potassium channel